MKRPTHQRGLSLIELMIGITVALFIAAAGGSLLVGQLREHRALALEARLTQDLRTAADLITRDLRRAGYWGNADADEAMKTAQAIAAITGRRK